MVGKPRTRLGSPLESGANWPHCQTAPALGAKFRHKVRVEVHLKDGSVMDTTVEAPRGSEQNFASADDVIAKYRKLALHALPAAQVDALCDAMLHAEDLDDAAQLVRCMTRAD